MTNTTARTKTRKATDRVEVDLHVLKDVYDRAKKRLVVVRKRERELYGASRTTLTEIGREAVLIWEPLPDQVYEATPRSPNGEAPDRTPFRFKLPHGPYTTAKKTIKDAGASVTQVVEEALDRFARTGR